MDTLPSAEFRRRYASLRAVTIVTVNGHIIGTWTPRGEKPAMDQLAEAGFTRAVAPAISGFGIPRPAPKPSKAKR